MVAEFQRISSSRSNQDRLADFNQSAFLRLRSPNCTEFERRRLTNAIAQKNRGLLINIATRESLTSPVPLEELILAGSWGYSKAIDRFNPHSGFKFSSYAVPLIRGAIKQYVRDKGRLVRISQTDQEIEQRIDKIEAIHKAEGIPTSRLDIARNLHNVDPSKITLEYLEELERMNAREYITPLDAENDDGPNFQVESWYNDDETLLSEALKASLEKLKHAEYVCIRGVYWQGMSEDDIAQDYGWHVEQVRGHLERAIAKLKSELEGFS